MPNVSCSWLKIKRYIGFFLIIFCSRNKIRQFFEARWWQTEERNIFILTKTLVLARHLAQEAIAQATSVQDTFLTTPAASLHVIRSDNQSKKKEKQTRIMEVDQKIKSYLARRVPPHARNTTQSVWNSFPNRNIFFGDGPRRAARTDIWTIKPLCSSEQNELHRYQRRTEFISWNKLCYGN